MCKPRVVPYGLLETVPIIISPGGLLEHTFPPPDRRRRFGRKCLDAGRLRIQFVVPDSFRFLLSFSFLVGLVVGGVGSIPGSLFGGVFVLFVPNIAERVSTGLAGAIYGVILLLVIYVMPSGAAGFVRFAAARLEAKGKPR